MSAIEMRAILINPWFKEVKEVQIGTDFREITKQLCNPLGPKVDIFCIGHQFGNGDVLYVDDEGLLKSGMRLFDIGWPDNSLLAGNGLILGSTSDGDSQDAQSSLVGIQLFVKWTNLITR